MPPKTSRDSVEALLSDLDSLGNDTATSAPSRPPSSASSSKRTATPRVQSAKTTGASDDAQSLLDDLDNMVQRRSATPKRIPDLSQSVSPKIAANHDESTSIAAPAAQATPTTAVTSQPTTLTPVTSTTANEVETPLAPEQQPTAAASNGGGWNGWGSVWSTASKLADQARAELEKRAQSEQAKDLTNRGWGLAQGVRGFVKEAGLEKLGEDLGKVGKRGWTEVLNAVAPPISAHEVIQVTLSHDMVGFDGVEEVTFQVFGRVMESQVSRGLDQQLIVNKAPQSRRQSQSSSSDDNGSQDRDMKAVEGYEQAWRLAEAKLTGLIEAHEPERPKTSNITVPVSYCPVFLRIQPVQAPLPGSASTPPSSSSERSYISFLLLLQDPSHGLSHKTCSQCFPMSWLSESFEQNPWIEQAMVDILDGALTIIGQDYVNGRQSGKSRSAGKEEVEV